MCRPKLPVHKFAEPVSEDGGAPIDTEHVLTPRLRRAAQSGKGRFLLATFQEVVESIRPDAACLQVCLPALPTHILFSHRRQGFGKVLGMVSDNVSRLTRVAGDAVGASSCVSPICLL